MTLTQILLLTNLAVIVAGFYIVLAAVERVEDILLDLIKRLK